MILLQFTPIDPRDAADRGDVEQLRILAVLNRTRLYEEDVNGWQPIHLAARAGHADVVDFLLKSGADGGAITNQGHGNTPLEIAIEYNGEDNPVSSLLRNAADGSNEEL